MDLDRAHRDAQLVGDELVQPPGGDPVRHVLFALGQAGQAGGALAALGVCGTACGLDRQRALHPLHQGSIAKGLFDEVEGAVLQRVHRHRDVAMAGQKDHRQIEPAFDQRGVQLQA